MSLHHRFGGTWTEEKLERLKKYLAAYMKIFTQNPRAAWYKTIYVDAFAGTGYRTRPEIDRSTARLFSRDEEAILFQKGSAVIALETEPSFDEYLFVDLASDHVRELELLKARYPEKAHKVRMEQQEANQFLASWCKSTNWGKTRAVVFLDPYGGQVEWETIQAIAQTNAIDLWVLFPVGAVVNRLLIRNKPPSGAWAARLTKMFGTEAWKDAFYRPTGQLSMFGGQDTPEKHADFESIGQFFIERLETVFAKVASNPRALYNSKNIPLFLLCFAAGNPRKASLAVRMAQDILGK